MGAHIYTTIVYNKRAINASAAKVIFRGAENDQAATPETSMPMYTA